MLKVRGGGGPIVRNKANRPPGRCRVGRPTYEGPSGNRAKRTQFGRSAGAAEGETCKTNPIRHAKQAGSWPGPFVRNKPNWGSPTGFSGGDCAEQTQFRRADRPGSEADHAKRSQFGRNRAGTPNPRRGEGQSCETKPIPGRAGSRRAEDAKQSQFHLGTPLELAGWVGYHSCPGNRPYTD